MRRLHLEVAMGAAFGGARAIATMKHVGLNVASDPLFTVAYTGVSGALIIVSADDPGMASSQNEQDNRHYAVAAGVPMFEPSDSQEAYDFLRAAVDLSERWRLPVLLRLTTRVCHSKTVVCSRPPDRPPHPPHFQRDIPGRVMIPAHARPAHRRLRAKLAEIAAWNETHPLNRIVEGEGLVGIITSGITFMHVREAAPSARVLKLGLTHPLPMGKIAQFAAGVERCWVIEEGDPYLAEAIGAQGIAVQRQPECYRFGELNVDRVRRILDADLIPEAVPVPGRPPQLCEGCAHRVVFEALGKLDCIVAGDIGCYTLGVLPPYEAMDSCVCMGASVGVGLGLRQVLPAEQAGRVVSVIGDSTFVHSGITGLVEMVYNPPPTGHVVIILDNRTTAMTGHQEHPGTGRTLDHQPTGKVVFEELGKALGIPRIHVIEPHAGSAVGIECPHHAGLHLFEDHFYPEIIDLQTGQPCPDGIEGELVFTTLTKQAMPMIRYRTHDISTLIPEPCACGRTVRRIKRIARRSDDMLIIRGVNLFPSQIEAALLAVEGTLPHYQILLTRDRGLDQLEVQVEVTPEFFSDRISALEGLQNQLAQAIENTAGLRAAVRLVEPHTIQCSEGKAKRVIDRRGL